MDAGSADGRRLTGDDGRTSAVIGYGSLLDPDEANEEFQDLDPLLDPFVLRGYRRVFNNRSTWRNPEGKRAAVLNVESDPDSWCNVVLIAFDDETRPEDYEDRERGYHFEQVSADRLEPYVPDHGQVIAEVDQIEVPIGDRVESDIEPIPDYVDTCLDGARYWDRKLRADADTAFDGGFLQDFVRTTELADGTPFAEYLDRRSREVDPR